MKTDKDETSHKFNRDYRLYAAGICITKEFECEIDTVLLDAFILNSHPYKVWNKFSTNLIYHIMIQY